MGDPPQSCPWAPARLPGSREVGPTEANGVETAPRHAPGVSTPGAPPPAGSANRGAGRRWGGAAGPKAGGLKRLSQGRLGQNHGSVDLRGVYCARGVRPPSCGRRRSVRGHGASRAGGREGPTGTRTGGWERERRPARAGEAATPLEPRCSPAASRPARQTEGSGSPGRRGDRRALGLCGSRRPGGARRPALRQQPPDAGVRAGRGGAAFPRRGPAGCVGVTGPGQCPSTWRESWAGADRASGALCSALLRAT